MFSVYPFFLLHALADAMANKFQIFRPRHGNVFGWGKWIHNLPYDPPMPRPCLNKKKGVLFCSIQCSSSSVCLVFAVVCDLRILLGKPLAATSAWTLPYHTLRKKININNRKSADFLNPFGLKELFPWQSMPRACSNTYIAQLFCTKAQRRQKNTKNQNSAAARDENLEFF